MASLYPYEMIADVIDIYGENIATKVEQESNFQLAFTDKAVYDLDEIILLRRRDVGNAPMAVHVISKDNFSHYGDIALILLAADELVNRPELWEQEIIDGVSGPFEGDHDDVIYKKYTNIKEVPNYVGRLMEVLDPESEMNQEHDILNRLYADIPHQMRHRDGHIQINTMGDTNFFDILDIDDPDHVL